MAELPSMARVRLNKKARWLSRADMLSAWVDVSGCYRSISDKSRAALFELVLLTAARRDDLICRKHVQNIVGFDKRHWSRVIDELERVDAVTKLDEDCWSVSITANWILTRPRQRLPQEIRDAVFAKADGKCAYCAVTLTKDDHLSSAAFQVEHILPVVRGGTDEIENLTAACRRCNASKNGKTIDEWVEP